MRNHWEKPRSFRSGASSCRNDGDSILPNQTLLEHRQIGGASEHRAKLDVSHLLGHGRADVTDVYLASMETENL